MISRRLCAVLEGRPINWLCTQFIDLASRRATLYFGCLTKLETTLSNLADLAPQSRMPFARKLGLLGVLYFAQGVPFGFFTQALPVVMRQEGYALTWIGLSSLLALPWALKWLWAPILDSRYLPRLGRRRTWLLALQLATALLMLVLACFNQRGAILWLLVGSFVTNLLAASQDVATDGLAVELLSAKERGAGNGVQVAAYRLGMILGGGALLVLFDRLGFGAALVAMAGVACAALVVVLFYREPDVVASPPRVALPWALLKVPTASLWCGVLLSYKAGDALASGMVRPYLVDRGLDLSQVGTLVGAVGSGAGLAGALLGGLLTGRLGSRRALCGFGLLNAAALSSYAVLAHGWLGAGWLAAAVAVEHVTGGMATVALFTCMMQWCRSGHEGADYTLQASLVVVSTGVAHALAGVSAHNFGYAVHFTLATLATLGTAFVVWWAYPRLRAPGSSTGDSA